MDLNSGERQIDDAGDGRSKDRKAHTLRSQVGIGSESDCLLGHFEQILEISDADAGQKEEKL